MAYNLAYLILFAMFFSFFSIITTRYLSNKISQLTTYHTNENLRTRLIKVVSVYPILGIPSLFVVFFLLNEIQNSPFIELLNSTSSALLNLTSNVTYDTKANSVHYSNSELLLISAPVSVIIPFVTRVASLTKRPIPFECKQCIEDKTIGKKFFEKHKYITKLNCKDNENESKSDEDLIKCENIWKMYRERTISFAYSILGGVFLFMLLLSLLFISNILDKIKSMEDFQILQFGLQFLSEYTIFIEIPLMRLLVDLFYVAMAFISIFLIALSGEVLMLFLGGVSEFHMCGKKVNNMDIYQILNKAQSKLGNNRFFNKKPSK